MSFKKSYLILFLLMLIGKPLLASSPTMIRLRYTNCVVCHVSPQGRGILNQYGRGVDEAQSLRSGVYEPSQSPIRRFLNANGRINHDIRLVSYVNLYQTKETKSSSTYRRLSYINSTRITEKHRVSFTVGIDSSPKAATKAYYAPPDRTLNIATKGGNTYLVLTKALWEYRPKEGLEIAIGRDYLPTGVNISDHASFIRSRNRQGFTEVPTQLKLFWWSDKFQIMPFVFGPSGQEGAKYRQFGFGTLAGAVLLGGIVLFAAPRAQAGEFNPGEIGEEAVCLIFELITEVGLEVCNEFNCSPDERDCERICTEIGRGCFRTSRAAIIAFWTGVRSSSNAAKLECATIEDPEERRACKQFVRLLKGEVREEVVIARDLVREICRGEFFFDECLDVCFLIDEGIVCGL